MNSILEVLKQIQQYHKLKKKVFSSPMVYVGEEMQRKAKMGVEIDCLSKVSIIIHQSIMNHKKHQS